MCLLLVSKKVNAWLACGPTSVRLVTDLHALHSTADADGESDAGASVDDGSGVVGGVVGGGGGGDVVAAARP